VSGDEWQQLQRRAFVNQSIIVQNHFFAESKLLLYASLVLIPVWLTTVAVQIWWIFVVLACYRYVRDKAAAMTSLPQYTAQYTLVQKDMPPQYEEAAPIEEKVPK
jgi:hypothetical protein